MKRSGKRKHVTIVSDTEDGFSEYNLPEPEPEIKIKGSTQLCSASLVINMFELRIRRANKINTHEKLEKW